MKLIDISTPKHPNTFAQVDDEDFEWLSQWKWFPSFGYNLTFYAARDRLDPKTKKRTDVIMHREIAKTPPGMFTDHIDGNGLNNQKSNLRHATTSQNACNRGNQCNNTSGHKGVDWQKNEKRWRARIKLNGKRIHLGYFHTVEEAANAYKEAVPKIHGEFAYLTSQSLPTTGEPQA